MKSLNNFFFPRQESQNTMGKYSAAVELSFFWFLPRVRGDKPLVLLWLCVGFCVSRAVAHGSLDLQGASTHPHSPVDLVAGDVMIYLLCDICRVLGSLALIICEFITH